MAQMRPSTEVATGVSLMSSGGGLGRRDAPAKLDEPAPERRDARVETIERALSGPLCVAPIDWLGSHGAADLQTRIVTMPSSTWLTIASGLTATSFTDFT